VTIIFNNIHRFDKYLQRKSQEVANNNSGSAKNHLKGIINALAQSRLQ
jgi:hypothetical protein